MQSRISQSVGPDDNDDPDAPPIWSEDDEEAITHVLMWPNWPGFSDRERVLIEYAERFVEDHHSLDAAFYERLHEVFTDAEIVEATALIARHLAFGRMSHVLALDT
jgi:alkylhydroperoxidase family enzyme